MWQPYIWMYIIYKIIRLDDEIVLKHNFIIQALGNELEELTHFPSVKIIG